MACVLVVENDDDVRDALCEVLSANGVAVRLAAGGEEAIAQLEALEFPDMLLVEVRMPRMNGKQLLDWLQSHSAYDRVPVVVVSGELGAFQHPRAAAVLSKPFGIDELMGMLERFCPASPIRLVRSPLADCR